MKKSRIARPIAAVEPPAVRSLPLVELLVDTQAELFELMVRSGLRVLDAMLEEDRTALCGPRYAHQPARAASRAGTVPGDVVLGGRKVAVRRCCMNTRCEWGGVARTSRDPPQEPHYRDAVEGSSHV